MQEDSKKMPFRIARRHRLLIGFGVAFALVVIIVVVSFRSTVAVRDASHVVERTHEVLTTLETTLATVEEAEAAQRSYIITGDESYAKQALAIKPSVLTSLNTLDALIDEESVRKDVTYLRNEIGERLAYVEDGIVIRRRDGFEAARDFILSGVGRDAMERVRRRVARIRLAESDVLAKRRAASEAQARNTLAIVSVGTSVEFFLVAIIFFLVRRDARGSRALSRAMTDARDLAVQAASVRAQFLANMSHEIRTPMNAVVGMSALLLDTELDENQRDLAVTVQTSAEALLTIINDILDFSKIEAGKLLIESNEFELRPSVEATIDLFSDSAQAKGLEIGALFDHDLPLTVRGDSGRVRQVLTNFIGNAIKFTEHGSVIITLNKEREEDDTVVIRVSVTDTGVGMSDVVKNILFQPFTQADATTTRRYGGTGLGLAISKQLVDLMGGEIGVDSAEGKGSTFWFTLPLVVVPVADIPSRDERPALTGLRVLVIDASETHRHVIRHNVTAWRMDCDEAATGQEALERLRAAEASGRPYDLALVDVALPQMNGVVLARFIKCEPAIAPVKIVVFTSMASRLDAASMRTVGISGCLTKPVKGSALFDAIVTAVSGAQVLPPAPRTVSESSRASREHVLVLIAEDNPVNQKVAVRQLQRLGVTGDTVANGRQAVDAISHKRYDLVLMDCQMPEMDGYEATREIRKHEGRTRHTPIIALTANALQGDRERCLAAGMDDYLSKPVREEDLARALDRWLPERFSDDALAPDVLATLRQLGGGSDEFLREVAALFLVDVPPRLQTIGAAVQDGDAATLASAAHALKSSAGNMGAMLMRRLAEMLEQIGNSGTVDGADGLVRELSDEFVRVEQRLRELSAGEGAYSSSST